MNAELAHLQAVWGRNTVAAEAIERDGGRTLVISP